MLSKRPQMQTRRAALLGLLALAGCGLTPAFGTGGQAQVLHNAVRLAAPDTVAGFRLRERLEERLGVATSPRFGLNVDLTSAPTPATITTDGDTTRFNLESAADWALTDMAGLELATGTVNTFTSYSATGSTVATQAAANDAADRLAVALADLIAARLILAAADLPQ